MICVSRHKPRFRTHPGASKTLKDLVTGRRDPRCSLPHVEKSHTLGQFPGIICLGWNEVDRRWEFRSETVIGGTRRSPGQTWRASCSLESLRPAVSLPLCNSTFGACTGIQLTPLPPIPNRGLLAKRLLQGYLADKKQPPPLGPPCDPMYVSAVGS